jgi:hypothetical protein
VSNSYNETKQITGGKMNHQFPHNDLAEIWEKGTEYPKALMQNFLIQFYGTRCPDYYEDCLCCQAYKEFDEFFNNPYKENHNS